MRQAGAEAAQRASQKKAAKRGLISSNPKLQDVSSPSNVIDTKLTQASKESQRLTEIAASTTPTVLTAEGAKRTSVDKTVESESSIDAESKSPKSTEESLLQVRRTSSITKNKTTLATETALESTPSISEQRRFEERPKTHRGSSISEASKEEIEFVERSETIPEEDEDDESAPCVPLSEAKDGPTSTQEDKPELADVTHLDK
jgi:hypothetical protein